jgi:hypothetical protein
MVSLKKLIPLAFAGLAMGAIVLSPATGGIAFADVSGNTAEEIAAEQAKQAQEAMDNAYIESIQESNAVTNQQVVVNGNVVKTEADGMYFAKSIDGVAVNSSAQINEALGTTTGEKAYVTTWDVTEKTSPAAMASVNAAAAEVNATVGPTVQINVGKRSANGVDYSNTEGTFTTTIGIPAKFYVEGATYAVVHVLPGGATEILENKSTDPKSIVVDISTGEGVYSIIRLN